MGFFTRIKHGWNAFVNNRDPTYRVQEVGMGYSYKPDRVRLSRGAERTIVNALFNRIANDVANTTIQHVRLDEDGRYTETIDSGLNRCLNLEANIDQTGRALILDIVLSALDEGVVAVVPIDTDDDPTKSSSYGIETLRTGKIIGWHPAHVRVSVYNDRIGRREELLMPKRSVAIIENPFYTVINEPNSTMNRLIRKLALLDTVDEQASSGKLDLIIQLPYIIKSDARREQAEKRRKDIEMQLASSKYGIAYTDGTERITQLNRPVENNLMKQIEYLTNMVYGQLSMDESILNGTADEKTKLNYNNGTIEPFLEVIVNEFKRKFLTQTARTQGQSIMYFRDPFKLIPVAELAKIGDTFTRNEIMTKNEFRQKIGMKPSKDPKADQLLNSNISQPANNATSASDKPVVKETSVKTTEENQNGKV